MTINVFILEFWTNFIYTNTSLNRLRNLYCTWYCLKSVLTLQPLS